MFYSFNETILWLYHIKLMFRLIWNDLLWYWFLYQILNVWIKMIMTILVQLVWNDLWNHIHIIMLLMFWLIQQIFYAIELYMKFKTFEWKGSWFCYLYLWMRMVCETHFLAWLYFWHWWIWKWFSFWNTNFCPRLR